MPETTLTAARPGPVVLDLIADAIEVDVVIDGLATTATLAISGPAEVVDDLAHHMAAAVWTVRLPEQHTHAARGVSVARTAGGGTTVRAAHVTGAMSIVNGRVLVDGRELTGETPNTEPVRATATLPMGSALKSRIQAGHITTYARPLQWVEHQGASADLDIAAALALHAATQSGSVHAGDISGRLDIATASGSITVGSATGTHARLRTMSGAIRALGTAPFTAESMSGDIHLHTNADTDISAESMSGDVTVGAAPGTTPRVRARSMSGRVHTPR